MTAVATTLDRAVVADVMHHGVIACDPETPLAKAAQMMAAHRVHCVVVRGAAGAEWAVVSDLDLVGRLAAASIADCDAGSAAATPALTVSPSESLLRAAQVMAEHGVTHLLVTDRNGKPRGVLSTLDLAEALAQLS